MTWKRPFSRENERTRFTRESEPCLRSMAVAMGRKAIMFMTRWRIPRWKKGDVRAR